MWLRCADVEFLKISALKLHTNKAGDVFMLINKCMNTEDLELVSFKSIVEHIDNMRRRAKIHNVPYTWNHYCRHWEYACAILYSGIRAGMKVLDVGGAGSLLPYYLASAGCQVCATDVQEIGANDRLAELFQVELTYNVQDVQSLSYEDNSFDIVTCISVIEHVPDDATAMKEMARVLKKGGVLALSTDVHPQYLLYPDALRSARKKAGLKYEGLPDARGYDVDSLYERLIEPSGLELMGETDFRNVDLMNPVNRPIFGLYTFAIMFLRKEG